MDILYTNTNSLHTLNLKKIFVVVVVDRIQFVFTLGIKKQKKICKQCINLGIVE